MVGSPSLAFLIGNGDVVSVMVVVVMVLILLVVVVVVVVVDNNVRLRLLCHSFLSPTSLIQHLFLKSNNLNPSVYS